MIFYSHSKHLSKCPCLNVLVLSSLTHTAALFLCKSLPGVVALPLSIGDSALTASRACGPGWPLWPLAMLGPRALVTLFNTLAPTTPLQTERERARERERERERRGIMSGRGGGRGREAYTGNEQSVIKVSKTYRLSNGPCPLSSLWWLSVKPKKKALSNSLQV